MGTKCALSTHGSANLQNASATMELVLLFSTTLWNSSELRAIETVALELKPSASQDTGGWVVDFLSA